MQTSRMGLFESAREQSGFILQITKYYLKIFFKLKHKNDGIFDNPIDMEHKILLQKFRE